MPESRPLKAAVLGAGVLGIDLAERLTRSPLLTCALVAGRAGSTGLRTAAELGFPTSEEGIAAVTASDVDVVFDATNAAAHPAHWADLTTAGVLLVDLTPSGSGTMVAPTVNGHRVETVRHVSLVSCGGQAVLPVLAAVAGHCTPSYIEVATTVAAANVGPATRLNLDEYIGTTTRAIRKLTDAADAKVLLTLSPARPAPAFRNHIRVIASDIRAEGLDADVRAAADVQGFAPGYEVAWCSVEKDQITVSVTVTACGGLLPAHAGNVEIINGAAVELAHRYTTSRER